MRNDRLDRMDVDYLSIRYQYKTVVVNTLVLLVVVDE